MDVRGKARLKRRYVLVFGAVALLTVFLVERKQTLDRKIDQPLPPAATQPTPAAPAQPPTNAQVATTAAPAASGQTGAVPPGPGVMPSADPLPNDRSERGVTKQSCSTGAKEPQSGIEVSALVTGYMVRCPDKLFSAMDEIFEQEARDESWAAKLEEKIDQARGAGGVRLKGECHASLCRLDPDTSQPGACNRADVNHSLVMSVSNTELEGEIIYRFNPCARYFYTTVIPAWFVDPLRTKMGDGP